MIYLISLANLELIQLITDEGVACGPLYTDRMPLHKSRFADLDPRLKAISTLLFSYTFISIAIPCTVHYLHSYTWNCCVVNQYFWTEQYTNNTVWVTLSSTKKYFPLAHVSHSRHVYLRRTLWSCILFAWIATICKQWYSTKQFYFLKQCNVGSLGFHQFGTRELDVHTLLCLGTRTQRTSLSLEDFNTGWIYEYSHIFSVH